MEISQTRVVVAATSRTPIGKLGGKLSKLPASDLAAHVLKAVCRKAGLENLSSIDLVVAGHAVQSFFEPNTARVALQKAGFPESIPAYTIQHQCASGMNAAHQAFMSIRTGAADAVMAIGVESMSLAPLIINGAERYKGLNRWLTTSSPKFLRKMFKVYGPLPFFGLAESGLGPIKLSRDPAYLNMIKTAQVAADLCGVSREEADAYALLSQERALAARESGRLAREIDPIIAPGSGLVEEDEHPRKTDLDSLARLRDTARSRVVTAGNASGLGDGACALLICSETFARENGLPVLAELVDFRYAGRQALTMGLGPVAAVNSLLEAGGLSTADIGYWEINEAFAAQVLACVKRLQIPVDKLNLNGGGISLSHPLGMSGARIIGCAAQQLALNDDISNAVASLCVGGGQGAAVLLRRYR